MILYTPDWTAFMSLLMLGSVMLTLSYLSPVPCSKPCRHHQKHPGPLAPLPTTASSFSYAPEPLPALLPAASHLILSFEHSPPMINREYVKGM